MPYGAFMESVTWSQVLAWRMRRQFLLPESAPVPGAAPDDPGVVDVARRLAGVQAQVASAAELAVALRLREPRPGTVEPALLGDRSLVKTWAMRGTLHLLPGDEAGAYLAVCGAHRRWEQASWQKAFGATPADLEEIAVAAAEALAGGVALTREELTAEIVARTGSAHLAEVLGSGWGTLLKPLAWWGVLCHGPAKGNRVRFVSPADWLPGWTGVPGAAGGPAATGGAGDLDVAAALVIRAYLRAHGPTTPDIFDRVWLSRGGTRKAMLRGWFDALGGELVTVEVEGVPMRLLAADLDELTAQPPVETVRLLPGFDPYVLGAGTGTVAVVPAERRSEVSRTAGWISPVVVYGGRVAGVWRVDDDVVGVSLWEDLPRGPLADEAERVAAALGRPLRVTIG